MTAADDRCHKLSHLSEWISLKDMMERVSSQLDEGIPIPSPTTVRLQFAPQNKFSSAELYKQNQCNVQDSETADSSST